MKELYVTITGINHYYGRIPFKVGKKVKCVKEPENPFDNEAIRASMKNIGTVGYIANSTYTVANGTQSAGRLHDKVKRKFKVEVMFIINSTVICKVIEGIKEEQPETEEPIPADDLSLMVQAQETQSCQA